ncbi:MAG: hypothetical protein JJE05_04010 [Actinobacteria bacterium]|nr:hypothetical protein [Actinomycetota bacterium]
MGHSLGGWAALTVGADERVKAVVTIWLTERVVSWVERLASSHPGAPGRDG